MNPIPTVLTTECGLISTAMAAPDTPAASVTPSILRQPLLTALLNGTKTIDRVEIKEIHLSAHQQTGRHRHLCPVVGYIAEGSIFFQVEGQPAKVLRAGEAFFEPAQTTIVHFDATEEPARFIAYYLLGPEDHELIEMLP